MIEIRPRHDLGRSDRGWLRASHHFSIGEYQDPARMGWGRIRVWNDDEFAPGHGFPMHPHSDMEIVTYVRSGAITHEDSLGNRGRTEAGDVQVMSAGTGIRHSEYNLEPVPTRLFQIWIIPDRRGLAPSWSTRPFPKADRSGRMTVLATGLEEGGAALPIRAPARIHAAALAAGRKLHVRLSMDAKAYLVAPVGRFRVNGQTAAAGDGVAIARETDIGLEAVEDSELVLVETF
jgi:hypothetical protein